MSIIVSHFQFTTPVFWKCFAISHCDQLCFVISWTCASKFCDPFWVYFLQEMESQECRLVSLVTKVCILLLLSAMARAQLPSKPSPVFIFGDSLSDPGNNNYITRTLSRANNPPNGIDFPGGYATGRFTNGRTTVDITGKAHKLLLKILYTWQSPTPDALRVS